jgi:hypothetical protein
MTLLLCYDLIFGRCDVDRWNSKQKLCMNFLFYPKNYVHTHVYILCVNILDLITL